MPIAERIKREAGIATRVVGLIVTPEQAEAIVAEGKADMVAMARAMLDDPRWGWHAAQALGAEVRARRRNICAPRRSCGRAPRIAATPRSRIFPGNGSHKARLRDNCDNLVSL